MRRLFASLLLATLVLLPLSACDVLSGGENGRASLAGTYETEILVVETDTGSVDALERGSYIEMRLEPDSTVEEGVLFVSSEFTEEDTRGSRRIEFEGTWSRPAESTVTFDHEADTFIREVEWKYEQGRLEARTDQLTAVLRQR